MNEIIGKAITLINENDRIYKKYIYCDFRDCRLINIDLNYIEFIGCHFGNTTFDNVNLSNTKFIGCFTSVDLLPVKVFGTDLSQIKVKFSNLSFIDPDENVKTYQHWDENVIKMLSSAVNYKITNRTTIIRNYIENVKTSYDNYFYLILMIIMLDPEWDVYITAIRFIDDLPEEAIHIEKENTLKYLYSYITDANTIVRLSIFEIIEKRLPEYSMFELVIEKLYTKNDPIILNALKGIALIAQIEKYKHDIDRNRIKYLINNSVNKEIILECFEVIKKIKDEYFIQVILDFIKNTDDEDICGAGLQTLSYLDYLPDLDEYIMYLEHDSPKVRSEALWLAYYADDITIEKVKSIIESDNTGVLKTTYENIQEFDKQSS